MGRYGSRGGKSYSTHRRIRESTVKKLLSQTSSNVSKLKKSEANLISGDDRTTDLQCLAEQSTSIPELSMSEEKEEVLTLPQDYDEAPDPIFNDEEFEDELLYAMEDELSHGGCTNYDNHASEILRKLCYRHPSVSHLFLKDMLGCMKEIGIKVPSDPRTLLKSNVEPVITRIVRPGRYWHYGILALIDKLLFKGIVLPPVINIKTNVDGLPISNSSPANLWPIQITIDELKKPKPFIIGCYFHESKKPESSSDYLLDYVNDLAVMKTTGYKGIKIGSVAYPLDAPALAFVKQTQYHTGKNACQKCDVVGTYKCGRVCLPPLIGNDRTDVKFRDHTTYGEHHKSKNPGPLEHLLLQTDMVNSFPADPLHTRDLGVTKRLIMCWRGDLKLGNPFDPAQVKLKLGKTETLAIDNHLTSIKKYQPSEFNRKCRPISDYKHWKGSEFACFLDHTSIVVLKERVTEIIYKNFMCYYVAMRICASNIYSHLLPIAEILIKKFLNGVSRLYGEHAISFNMHNLLHIPSDVKRFGSLDSYSTASFESRLGTVKTLIRGGNRRLEQLANRLHENIDNWIDQINEGMVLD